MSRISSVFIGLFVSGLSCCCVRNTHAIRKYDSNDSLTCIVKGVRDRYFENDSLQEAIAGYECRKITIYFELQNTMPNKVFLPLSSWYDHSIIKSTVVAKIDNVQVGELTTIRLNPELLTKAIELQPGESVRFDMCIFGFNKSHKEGGDVKEIFSKLNFEYVIDSSDVKNVDYGVPQMKFDKSKALFFYRSEDTKDDILCL